MARRGSKAKTKAYNKAYYRQRKAYKNYVSLYSKREAMLESHGYQMYDQMLTWTQYKTASQDMRNTLKEEVKRGIRKSVGSVNKALVSEQAYELSERQGYAIFDFLRENAEKYGIKYDTSNINEILMQIREGSWLRQDVGIWDMINDFRDSYIKEHGDTEATRAILNGVYNPNTKKYEGGLVAQTFFGSP